MGDWQPLKADVEEAIVQAMVAAPGQPVPPAEIYRRFKDRGNKSSIYRWIASYLESGVPQDRAAKIIEHGQHIQALGLPAPRPEDPIIIDQEAQARVLIPRVPRLEESSGGVDVVAQLQECIAAARQVMDFAKTDKGGVRNAKLLLLASEHLRRTLDTCANLHTSMMESQNLDRFHQSLVDAVVQIAPEKAEAIFDRFKVLIAGLVT